MNLYKIIETIPDFPIPGVQFKDISSILANPEAFKYSVDSMIAYCRSINATKVIGVESRGFIFGTPIARELALPFVMTRKPGKLPGKTHRKEYALEYGTACLHIQVNTNIVPTDNVVIIDDLIATGGTAVASADLVHENFGVPKENISILALIDLIDLQGSAIIKDNGYSVKTLMEFAGE